MKRVLIVDCCIRREQSRTRRILDAFRSGLDPETCQQQYLCLMDEDLKPLTGSFFEERQQLLEQNDLQHPRFRYAHQFAEADRIVVAAPFYDLSFPALLKIYVENVSVDGITFRAAADGIQGLCRADQMVYLTSRGGIVPTGSAQEQATPYLKALCTFFGIGDFICIGAGGMDIAGYDAGFSLQTACDQAVQLARELSRKP